MLDKGLLAGLALLAAFWLNRLLKTFESRKAEELELLRTQKAEELEILRSRQAVELQAITQRAIARLPSYKSLWECLEMTSPTAAQNMTQNEREQLDADLRRWYFKDGNGLFLSLEAAKLLLKARQDLLDKRISNEEIRRTMSRLRTRLKGDLLVYGPAEEDVEVGIA